MMLCRTKPAGRVPHTKSTAQVGGGRQAPWGWYAGAPYLGAASPPPPLPPVCVCVCVPFVHHLCRTCATLFAPGLFWMFQAAFRYLQVGLFLPSRWSPLGASKHMCHVCTYARLHPQESWAAMRMLAALAEPSDGFVAGTIGQGCMYVVSNHLSRIAVLRNTRVAAHCLNRVLYMGLTFRQSIVDRGLAFNPPHLETWLTDEALTCSLELLVYRVHQLFLEQVHDIETMDFMMQYIAQLLGVGLCPCHGGCHRGLNTCWSSRVRCGGIPKPFSALSGGTGAALRSHCGLWRVFRNSTRA